MRLLLLALALAGCHVDGLFRSVASGPNPPADLQQLADDGSTALPVGAATDAAAVVLTATLTTSDAASTVRLEVEVRPVTESYENTPVATSGLVASGSTASIALSGLLDETGYHWQARAVDEAERASAWVPFGGAVDTATHFRVAIPDPPAAPTDLGQFRSNGNARINPGASTMETTVVLKATVTDPDSSSQLRLEVEVQPVGTPFTDTPSGTAAAAVANGEVAAVTVTGLTPGTSYRWQARAVDQTDRRSGWVAFGTGGADFKIAP